MRDHRDTVGYVAPERLAAIAADTIVVSLPSDKWAAIQTGLLAAVSSYRNRDLPIMALKVENARRFLASQLTQVGE